MLRRSLVNYHMFMLKLLFKKFFKLFFQIFKKATFFGVLIYGRTNFSNFLLKTKQIFILKKESTNEQTKRIKLTTTMVEQFIQSFHFKETIMKVHFLRNKLKLRLFVVT